MIDTTKFLGLTKKSAQNLAEKQDLIFRLIRIDSKEFLPYPDKIDIRADRVCIEIDEGKVSKATAT